MGDPAGIGPEIIVKALSRKETYEKCHPIVTGDAEIMRMAVGQMGADLHVSLRPEVRGHGHIPAGCCAATMRKRRIRQRGQGH